LYRVGAGVDCTHSRGAEGCAVSWLHYTESLVFISRIVLPRHLAAFPFAAAASCHSYLRFAIDLPLQCPQHWWLVQAQEFQQ
jgi:hypothetical protein